MKKECLILLALLGASGLLISCADLKNVPEGSQSLGVFEGSFEGKLNEGTIRIELFKMPQGGKMFTGNLTGGNVQATVFVRGTITANKLEGKFRAPVNGTLTGQLSAAGNQLSGSFTMESSRMHPDSGTWKAIKK